MAMKDVSNMARVEHFSNMIIPTLWFEIALDRLPTNLNNRFIFYLNLLPVFVKFCYYGSLIGGPLMLIWSIVRASQQVGAFKVQQNVRSGNVYMACEENSAADRSCMDSEGGEDSIDGNSEKVRFIVLTLFYY